MPFVVCTGPILNIGTERTAWTVHMKTRVTVKGWVVGWLFPRDREKEERNDR